MQKIVKKKPQKTKKQTKTARMIFNIITNLFVFYSQELHILTIIKRVTLKTGLDHAMQHNVLYVSN